MGRWIGWMGVCVIVCVCACTAKVQGHELYCAIGTK